MGRCHSRFFAFLMVLVLWAAATPRALNAQAPTTVSTSVYRDAQGSVVSTLTGAAGAAYHPSRVLVRFRNGAPASFLPGSGPSRSFPGDPNLHAVDKPPGLSVAEAVRRYQANPNVQYAEPDYVVQAVATTPPDPMWSQQWDMTKIAAPLAWDLQTAAPNVVVVVIDTGIDYSHADLTGNLWMNPVDGSHGFTCMNGTCVPGGLDDFGHGTHVAGTIGATSDAVGIAGINWKVQLLSLKFLGSNGSGLISDAVLCFQKVLALKQAGYNIRVTSNSWAGGGFSQALKDAMVAVETAGVVNVCAAGNNAVNADITPVYPAAYDNRAIISVLASDSNDVGAGFTNWGLASVDIAAPGVSTLSTVPTGSCTLCDASGYKVLSGTSMATPHVSGVMAAMLQKAPALTAAQARDALLDPGSYDAVLDSKAQSTSTGGRLNFAKALGSPLLTTPKLNGFPTLTMGPDVSVAAGGLVNLTATGSDPDGDTLRTAWSKSVSTVSQWLLGWTLNSLFPNASGSSASFTAPSTATTTTVPYDAAVADGHGGGAHGRSYVTVSAGPPDPPPTGTLTLSSPTAPVGGTIFATFPVSDSGGGPTAWEIWAGGPGGASGSCCFTGSSVGLTMNSAGVYRIGVQAMDRALNVSARSTQVVSVGGATGTPPIVNATLDKVSGPVPLTVNIDMSGSTAPGGTIQYYFFICGGGGFTPASLTSQGSCTFAEPGPYWILLEIQDSRGNVDILSAYVSATPAGGGGGGGGITPPSVSITSPGSGATVSGYVDLVATASDASGISKVEFHLDSQSGLLLGTAPAAAYKVTWDSGTVSAGPHTIYAIATANNNNTNTASVGITVKAPTPPAVVLTSPASGSVARKSTITLAATVAPQSNYSINRVDFLVNSAVVCSDTTSPYSCTWKIPAAVSKLYTVQAKAYDAKGQVGSSSIVSITAK